MNSQLSKEEQAAREHVTKLYGECNPYDRPDSMRIESFLAGCDYASPKQAELIESLKGILHVLKYEHENFQPVKRSPGLAAEIAKAKALLSELTTP